MTDFVKVNFKDGEFIIAHKSSIELSMSGNEQFFYCRTLHISILHIAQLLTWEACDRTEPFLRTQKGQEITKEEYERLCKVLGVE